MFGSWTRMLVELPIVGAWSPAPPLASRRPRLPADPGMNRIEKLIARAAGMFDLHDCVLAAEIGKQAFVISRIVELIEQIFERAAADLDAEMIGGDIFEGVGLVE